MPLPLYGSGGRTLRTTAANWPTACLSGPDDRDVGRVGDGHADARRGLEHDLVGVADLQRHRVGLLQLRLVADADDLELLGVAVGDPLDHVGDQAAGQAVQGAALPLVVGPADDDLLAGLVVADADLAPVGATRACPWGLRPGSSSRRPTPSRWPARAPACVRYGTWDRHPLATGPTLGESGSSRPDSAASRRGGWSSMDQGQDLAADLLGAGAAVADRRPGAC